MRWKAAFIAAACAIVIAFGLGVVLQQALAVAPWRETAARGRLHPHLQHVVRFRGDAVAVRAQVHRAVQLEPPPPLKLPDSWPRAVLETVDPSFDAGHVIVLPGGPDDLAWALPGAYLAVRAHAPIVFVGRELSGVAGIALAILGLPAVVAAPEQVVPEAVLTEIGEYVPVTRVAGRSLPRHAVAIAEARLFDWEEGDDYVLVAPSEALAGLAALPLADTNAATLLFSGDDGGLPAATDRALWRRRGRAFLVGEAPSLASEARIDLALGDGRAGLDWLEAVAAPLVALGLACGAWVLAHGLHSAPHLPLPDRLAWAWTATLAPALGLVLYLRAPRTRTPASWRTTRGCGAPVLLALAYVLGWYGLPEEVAPAGALVAWPLVQGAERSLSSLQALAVTAATVAAVTVVAWALLRALDPEGIAWFGAMWAASAAGFAIAWSVNAVGMR